MHPLFIAHAGGVDDAGALFGACHLPNEGIVGIHAYSYLQEEGRRKEEEGERGQGKEKRRKNPPSASGGGRFSPAGPHS
jgi:hypothetical protein